MQSSLHNDSFPIPSVITVTSLISTISFITETSKIAKTAEQTSKNGLSTIRGRSSAVRRLKAGKGRTTTTVEIAKTAEQSSIYRGFRPANERNMAIRETAGVSTTSGDRATRKFKVAAVIFFLETAFLWCYTPVIPKTEGRWRVSAANAGALLSEQAADLEAEPFFAEARRLGTGLGVLTGRQRELC
jgi:hypothetical protein